MPKKFQFGSENFMLNFQCFFDYIYFLEAKLFYIYKCAPVSSVFMDVFILVSKIKRSPQA